MSSLANNHVLITAPPEKKVENKSLYLPFAHR